MIDVRSDGDAWALLAAASLAAALLLGCSESADVVAREEQAPGTIDPNQPPEVLALSGDLNVNDPGVVEVGGVVYLFDTGPGIPIRTSVDLLAWQRLEQAVFEVNPAWIAENIVGVTDLWNPEVSRFGDLFHLYYAASTYRSDRSCVGHATATQIGGPWTDQGPLICSNTGATPDDYNAIDPSVALDDEGVPWLVFGSFASGIHLVRLDDTGARADEVIHPVAARPDADNALQASALVHRGDQFYLFTSFDLCCRGIDSTHRIMVSRSADVLGPYVDRDGLPALDGGGSPVVEGDERWRGPGSSAILDRGPNSYLFYHVYDANDAGRTTLRISELIWDDAGWPIAGGP